MFRPYEFSPDRMGIFGVCVITSDCGQNLITDFAGM